jgi:dsDNA-binding SOS-regulon protein
MLTEKEQDSINRVLKNHIIEYYGDFLFEGDSVKFYFKIKLDGTRKMMSVGEYYDYVIVDVIFVDADERVKKILAILVGKNKERLLEFLKNDYRFSNNIIRTISDELMYFSDGDYVRVHLKSMDLSDKLFDDINKIKNTA